MWARLCRIRRRKIIFEARLLRKRSPFQRPVKLPIHKLLGLKIVSSRVFDQIISDVTIVSKSDRGVPDPLSFRTSQPQYAYRPSRRLQWHRAEIVHYLSRRIMDLQRAEEAAKRKISETEDYRLSYEAALERFEDEIVGRLEPVALKTYGDVKPRQAFSEAQERHMLAVRVAAAVDRKAGWGSVRARRAWMRVARRCSPKMVAALETFQAKHKPLAPGGWRLGA